MKLTGNCQYLLLSRIDELTKLKVDVVSSTDEAIARWDWTTRSSPIFPFDGPAPPNLASDRPSLLFFVGPVDPGILHLDVAAYATFGTYNLILHVYFDNSEAVRSIHSFLKENDQVRWECWEVLQNIVRQKRFSADEAPAVSSKKIRRSKVAPGLSSAEEENSTLFAAAATKARRYFPDVARELEIFSSGFRMKLESDQSVGDNAKLSWIVNVNAHLSRYTSQAFSGVSPIESTESHFWTHSLLGTGMACQALVNMRRFCEKAVGPSDWISLIDSLELVKIPAGFVPLNQRNAGAMEEWTDLEEMLRTQVQEDFDRKKADHLSGDERLPLIVCFSGRDGFRSTPFSLTAPLEVISGANAYGWTPLTLSHEICHVWISGILAAIFPALSDKDGMTDFGELVSCARHPRNLLDELRFSIYCGYYLLQREAYDVPDHQETFPEQSRQTWVEVVEQFQLQMNETLTHILDYQFFYQQDEERYIKAIWSSWDVIPNIKDRLSSYLIRSACAMLSERLNHENSLSVTLDRLEELLRELHGAMPDANYLSEAITILGRDRNLLMRRLLTRQQIVRIAKIFFTNRLIAARLDREYRQPGGPYDELSWLMLDEQQIWNPLKFVAHFSKERNGDKARSLWILSKIAFMRDPDATFA